MHISALAARIKRERIHNGATTDTNGTNSCHCDDILEAEAVFVEGISKIGRLDWLVRFQSRSNFSESRYVFIVFLNPFVMCIR